jgi:hypothetical protein
MRSLMESLWSSPMVPPGLSNRDWETLLAQARQSRLLARVAAHYSDKGWLTQVPPKPRVHLESGLCLADRQQHEVRWEVNRIEHALNGLNIPVVLLKGAAYLMGQLPAARGRLFSDIDLLVSRDNLAKTESALFAAGWICEERDAYNQRYYREWMHEIPPLRHVQRNTYIDLHHTITPPTSRFNVDGRKLLANVQPLNGHPNFYVLAPEDMVLHSAVHLFQEGEFGHGLRDLLDLNDLLLHFGEQDGFWTNLLNRADELSLQIPLFHALFHIRRLLGTTAPVDLQARVENLGPNFVFRALMAWMLGLALRPDHPSCNTRLTGLARWLLYVRSHALRMPFYLVVPHLARKAWMGWFPKKKAEQSAG